MNDPFKTHGAFSWSDLATTDVEGAKKFYIELLGWETEEMPSTSGTYTVIKAAGEGIGGIISLPPMAPAPMWGSYITVDDVNGTAEKAQQLGGNLIVPLTDVPGVGRFCMIQDPQGAVFSIITYEQRS